MAEGWRVEAEGAMIRSAGSFSLRVQSSGVDWFELESEIDFNGGENSVTGVGISLTLQPASNLATIVIGGTADSSSAALDITDVDIAALANGFGEITIGASAVPRPNTVWLAWRERSQPAHRAAAARMASQFVRLATTFRHFSASWRRPSRRVCH